MNMQLIDWVIVGSVLAFVTVLAAFTKRYTQSVADFLAAGRSAGRYVITVSEGAAALGAITIVAMFEKFYAAGFTAIWWDVPIIAIGLFIALSGLVVYRFRQTRALTMAQFFEMRYSRRFRIFAGILAFGAGLINFGIFPAVGSRFFIYFCGLPDAVTVLGISAATFPLIMVILLGISLFFTFMGGQVAVIVTDFVQGLFCMIVFLVIFIVLWQKFSWTQISESLAMAPADASLAHPFNTSNIEGFNLNFFLIGIFAALYSTMTWQGTSGYNCCARNPHEAKMGKVLGYWRYIIQGMLTVFVPLCAYTYMHHPDFAGNLAEISSSIGTIENSAIQKQMTVPIVLSKILPVGVMGMLCSVMLAAFISTHDTYLHSWGSIFIQDVIAPLAKRPLDPKKHIMVLRLSICGVAVFIFFFSLLFPQTDYILMFFAITGSIYMAGAGSVIIGGLYWKGGTTAAAWGAMLVGCVLSVSGIVAEQWAVKNGIKLGLNGQHMMLIAMVSAIITYVVISLRWPGRDVDMDKLFHRGKYAVEDDVVHGEEGAGFTFRSLKLGKDFSRWDKVIYLGFFGWITCTTMLFLVVVVYSMFYEISSETWIWFWHGFLKVVFILGAFTTAWFTIGGLKDIKDMFHRLRTGKRDDRDDGSVTGIGNNCRFCDYNLTENISGICPECGHSCDGR